MHELLHVGGTRMIDVGQSFRDGARNGARHGVQDGVRDGGEIGGVAIRH